MAAVTICSDCGAPKNKVCHCFLIYLPWSDGIGCHDLRLLKLSFKPTFSLSSHFHRESLVLCFLLRTSELIGISPSNLDSSLCIIQLNISHDVLAYMLNKQGDNIQAWHTPFPTWNQSVVPYSVLNVSSWPAYRFLKREAWAFLCSGALICANLKWEDALRWSFLFIAEFYQEVPWLYPHTQRLEGD